jgi:signal transduction histidine kinase
MYEIAPDRPGKILIVEDAPSVARFTQTILQGEYETRIAASGEDALTTLQSYQPDIILLDNILPGMSGLDVCQEVRSGKNHIGVKIIMVSSRAEIDERIEGYNAGVDDYLGKPYKKEELQAKVRVFLRLKLVEDELRSINIRLNEQVKIRTDQLVNAAKMAAIGKSTAGIVHNLNNPLQAILGYSQLLELKFPDNPHIEKLKTSATLMKEMIAAILMNSREENTIKVNDIDLNELLKNQIEMKRTNRFFKHQVQTKLDLQPIPLFKGVYAHFSQSLGNLIKNAVEAMYHTENKTLTIQTAVKKGQIRITISDTGCGMAPETIPKIFDPFFTTKPLSSADDEPTGTGIGLASSKEMIEAYGGTIAVESQLGAGSRFLISLPLETA